MTTSRRSKRKAKSQSPECETHGNDSDHVSRDSALVMLTRDECGITQALDAVKRAMEQYTRNWDTFVRLYGTEPATDTSRQLALTFLLNLGLEREALLLMKLGDS